VGIGVGVVGSAKTEKLYLISFLSPKPYRKTTKGRRRALRLLDPREQRGRARGARGGADRELAVVSFRFIVSKRGGRAATESENELSLTLLSTSFSPQTQTPGVRLRSPRGPPRRRRRPGRRPQRQG